MLGALADGVSALLIRVGESGVAPAAARSVLAGVYLSMAPVLLDAGADYSAACEAMLALAAQVEPDQRATLSIDLGADPLTAPLSGRPAPTVDDVVAVATRVADDRGVRAITVDGHRLPQPGRQRDVGARRQHRGGGGLPAGAHRIRTVGRRSVAANQFPARGR